MRNFPPSEIATPARNAQREYEACCRLPTSGATGCSDARPGLPQSGSFGATSARFATDARASRLALRPLPGQGVHPDRVDQVRRDLPRAEKLTRQALLVRSAGRADAADRDILEPPRHPRS